MRTLDEVLDHIAFHPATPETAATFDKIRKLFIDLTKELWPLLPDGPDKTTAMRALIAAQREAIAVVAVNQSPADWENPHVARVLPHGDVALEPTTPEPPLKVEEGLAAKPGRCICQGSIVPAGVSQHRVEGTLHVRPGYGAECEKTVQASAADYQ